MANQMTGKVVSIIGAASCDGQNLSGVDMGPNALRCAGVASVITNLGWEVVDRGDVRPTLKTVVETEGEATPSTVTGESPRPVAGSDHEETTARILNCQSVGQYGEKLFREVVKAAADGHFVLTLGGDHGVASATISGVLTAHPELRVIWVDAHGDCNTPDSSPSGNYHGMPAAHVMGWFRTSTPDGFEWFDECPRLKEDRMGILGLRDIDEAERRLIGNSKVAASGMDTIDRVGLVQALRDTLYRIDPDGKYPLHLSFDIDACDPAVAPGTGTCARGGLTFREARLLCEELSRTGRLVSMDLVEVNPAFDVTEHVILHGDDPTTPQGTGVTARVAVELISFALGKRLLL